VLARVAHLFLSQFFASIVSHPFDSSFLNTFYFIIRKSQHAPTMVRVDDFLILISKNFYYFISARNSQLAPTMVKPADFS
jgi:hypothetical protein